ncbi:hypothetical protein L3X38_018445 [Prunus dulcis]|uniref:Uncharacterized protein n=1 Tax=Prunus dulcis TaxID=3755 RepID=A0AAD4ZBM4_PRUDU|nr:hypothetical protein L3X38_018445 [Prunus dulcis]
MVKLFQDLITGPFSRSEATLCVSVELFIFFPPLVVPWQPSPMSKVTNFSRVPTRSYIFLAYRTCHITFVLHPETIAYARKSFTVHITAARKVNIFPVDLSYVRTPFVHESFSSSTSSLK